MAKDQCQRQSEYVDLKLEHHQAAEAQIKDAPCM